MPEKGYLELRQAEIQAERVLRDATDAVWSTCVDLIRRYASQSYDHQEDERFFEIPVVEWSEDGKELAHLRLKDSQGFEISEDNLVDVREAVQYSRVREINFVYYPHSDGLNLNDVPVTLAYIYPSSGIDDETEILGFNGENLSLEDTHALHNDIKRYQDLLERGKTEKIRQG